MTDPAYIEDRLVMDSKQELVDHIYRLREALARIAVVEHVRLAEGGGTVPNGLSCKLCRAECGPNAPLVHNNDCLI